MANRSPRRRGLSLLAVALGAALLLPTAVAAQDEIVPDESISGEITVGMVGNPQMVELQNLLPDFNARYPNIKVNLLILPENEIRATVTTDVATGAGTFDVATVGMYEVPQWAANGWIDEVGTTLDANPEYDSADFFDSIRNGLSYDGKLYAAPFYGESSFLFYRTDLFEDAGLTMPEHPTWDEVAEFAKTLHKPDQEQYGICLRGLPGWGEQGAPLGTVINTFGGRWYDAEWNEQITSPESTEAIKFYIDLVKNYGQPGAVSSGFTEVENLFVNGKCAMWYDATSPADFVFDPKNNPFSDRTAVAFAPVKVKDPSGWLWAWAFALESVSDNKEAAYKFMEWATGKDYPQLVYDSTGTWGGVPSGHRKSLYENPGYAEFGAPFNDVVLESLATVDPLNATVFDDTPYVGIQFVQIPEFQDLGTRCTQEFAGAMAGDQSAEDAIAKCGQYADEVAVAGGYRE
jgi:sorbitol/mannitol transport system substrate-binding protein